MVTNESLGLQKLMCPRKESSLLGGVLCCELYEGVEGIEVDEKLLAVFCSVDNKGIIYIPKPDPGMRGGA